MQQTKEKKFFVSEIIVFQLIMINSLYQEQNDYRGLPIFNTMTADDKYCLPNSEDLPQPIQMDLSKKSKTFSEFFTVFLETTSNFPHVEKEDDPHS